jgi:protein-tyrosine sulfotransferase
MTAIHPPAAPRVIFIRGITPRSGTNYLRDLLLLHPACERARSPVWEDFALDDAAVLDRYIHRLGTRWPQAWGVQDTNVDADLWRGLGNGLIEALIEQQPGRTTVAKTPSVRGLGYFFRLFPEEPLLLLVRDGRSVVESLTVSFGRSFDQAAAEWTRGAKGILRFRKQYAAEEGTRWLLVRYENLLSDAPAELSRILAFAALDPAAIAADVVKSLPVRGSSSFGARPSGVHWQPVPQDESFQPARRWAGWCDERHARFNWIVGEAMEELGYELQDPGRPSLRGRLGHHARDALTAVARARLTTRRQVGARIRR